MTTTLKIALSLTSLIIFSCSEDQSLGPKKKISKTEQSSRPTTPVIANQVVIGTQIWTNTNLQVNKYRNGDVIPEVNDPEIWKNLTTGAYCRSICDNNIKLYNWYAVNDARGLAPQGWHIPSLSEVTTLANFLGGFTLAGNKLKGQSSTWYPVNQNITNSSGFTGLPFGGKKVEPNQSYACSSFAIWWTTTENASQAKCFLLQSYSSGLSSNNDKDKREGFTIRLVKD